MHTAVVPKLCEILPQVTDFVHVMCADLGVRADVVVRGFKHALLSHQNRVEVWWVRIPLSNGVVLL